MRIERKVYFEEKTADISGLTTLPLEQLRALREEYAAAEQAAFAALQQQAAAWEEQAGKTPAIDKAIEYVRTPEVKHTANQWEAADYGKHISNRVYQRRYRVSENTRNEKEKEKTLEKKQPDNRTQKYTEAQNAVIRHIKGPMNVIAVPGAGKTFSLVQRLLHMIKGGAFVLVRKASGFRGFIRKMAESSKSSE